MGVNIKYQTVFIFILFISFYLCCKYLCFQISQHELKIIEKSVIQKVVDGMKSEGRTYKGKKHRYFVLAADCITVNPVYKGMGAVMVVIIW